MAENVPPQSKYQRFHWEKSYGEIPEKWEFVTIGSLFVERKERSNDTNKYPLHSFTIEKGVTAKTEQYERSFLLKDKEKNKFALVYLGDFVFNPMNLRFGAISMARIDRPVSVSAYYNILVPIADKVDSVFIEALLRSTHVLDLYNKIAIGSLLEKKRVHLSILERTYVPLPPFEEQCRIGKILALWDTAIEKTVKLIEAKEKRLKWLTEKLINRECRHWKHLHTKNIFESISEKKNGNEELLSVTQDRGVIPRFMLEGRVMSPEGSTEGYKLIKEGDFAVSLRSFQGGIEYSQYQGLISPAYTVLRPKLRIHNEFYRHFFKTYIFIEKYLNIAVIGIRDGKQISIPDFMTVKIPYPPIDQQNEIAEILNTARQEIDLLRKQAEAYRKQKLGMMQKLLTGRWRVKVPEEVS